MMAADQTVLGVPPSLSAKVVGYVDSSFYHIVPTLNHVFNYTALTNWCNSVTTVVFKPVVALAHC